MKTTKEIIEYIYDFAWNYGRLYHIGNADEIIKAVSERVQLPEEFLSAHTPPPSAAEVLYVACDEHDPDMIGSYTSADGQSLCYVKLTASRSYPAGWVRVEDGLPDHDDNRDSEWCNVCIDGKVSHIPAWHKGDSENYPGRWFQYDVPYEAKNVTHWQPLPSPPQSVSIIG